MQPSSLQTSSLLQLVVKPCKPFTPTSHADQLVAVLCGELDAFCFGPCLTIEGDLWSAQAAVAAGTRLSVRELRKSDSSSVMIFSAVRAATFTLLLIPCNPPV